MLKQKKTIWTPNLNATCDTCATTMCHSSHTHQTVPDPIWIPWIQWIPRLDHVQMIPWIPWLDGPLLCSFFGLSLCCWNRLRRSNSAPASNKSAPNGASLKISSFASVPVAFRGARTNHTNLDGKHRKTIGKPSNFYQDGLGHTGGRFLFQPRFFLGHGLGKSKALRMDRIPLFMATLMGKNDGKGWYINGGNPKKTNFCEAKYNGVWETLGAGG